MFKGKYVYNQLVSLVSRYEFDKCVHSYKGNYRARDLKCWQQFLMMLFGQLTYRESLNDIINCLEAHAPKVYHLGITKIVAVSTLSRANENRDYRIWVDYATYLIQVSRPLYIKDNDFELSDLDYTIYALDASVIDLCLSIFDWAKFRKHKGAIKLHALLDLRGNIPVFIHITHGKVHEVKILDMLEFEANAFYVVDKGYYDFERLFKIYQAKAFFIIRAKSNLKFRRLYSTKVDKTLGLRCDQTIKLTGIKTAKVYPAKLRRIKYYDKELNKTFVFLTNNFELEALIIAKLYKNRWQIELFFKWIKQHLKIKKFMGESENAVKTQIWIAICTYLLVVIAKKKCQSELSLYQILQILSVSAFDKTPINQLLTKQHLQKKEVQVSNQLTIFDL